jgi:peptidoglycan-associated lipoprotein
MRSQRSPFAVFAVAVALVVAPACHKKPPVAKPTTPPSSSNPQPFPGGSSGSSGSTGVISQPPSPPPVPATPDVSGSPLPLAGATPDAINENSPLKPVFFLYDSDQLDDTARAAITANADVLKQYGTWVITIEGHCDERGTAEYNLALGDRRALAVKTYLLSLGVGGDRVRTVSYGKEFPFDPGHDDAAWAKNRRAQFMVTSSK